MTYIREFPPGLFYKGERDVILKNSTHKFRYNEWILDLLTTFTFICNFACSLCFSVPLTMYTSPSLRITSAPVHLLISMRFFPHLPNTKPLYGFGTSTSSPGGASLDFRICISFCKNDCITKRNAEINS